MNDTPGMNASFLKCISMGGNYKHDGHIQSSVCIAWVQASSKNYGVILMELDECTCSIWKSFVYCTWNYLIAAYIGSNDII